MTVAGGETCAAYDAFAPYYDAFTSESDYDAWARETLAHARLHGLRGDRLLDLACGTGLSFMPFLERGFHVTACDFSTAMLAEAARRAPAARLVHADIRALPDLHRLTGLVRPATLGRSYVYDLRTMTVTHEDVPVVAGCPVCGGAAAS